MSGLVLLGMLLHSLHLVAWQRLAIQGRQSYLLERMLKGMALLLPGTLDSTRIQIHLRVTTEPYGALLVAVVALQRSLLQTDQAAA
jgi:hypothetical protein